MVKAGNTLNLLIGEGKEAETKTVKWIILKKKKEFGNIFYLEMII